MNLRDLHYLIAVFDQNHFGRAAEFCHISQPTLSMQIKKLEEYLGVQLIERTNRQLLFTPEGKAIVDRARRIVLEANELVEYAKSTRDPLAGELRLGAFPTLAPYYFPQIVPSIMKALPKVRLLLIEEKTDILLASLKAGTVDAALLALPVDKEGLETMPLFMEPFLLAVPNAHPLAQRTTITIADLIQEPLLLLEDGHCLRTQALEVCSLVGAKERQDFRATSLETLRQMVIAGVGITLMPQMAVLRKEEGITYIPFDKDPPQRTIGLVWRTSYARYPLLNQLTSLMKVLPV